MHELKCQHSVTMVNVGILICWARATQKNTFVASKLGQYVKRSSVFSKPHGDQPLVFFSKAFPRIRGIVCEESGHHFRVWPKAVSCMLTGVLADSDHVGPFAAMHGVTPEHLSLPCGQLRNNKRHTFNCRWHTRNGYVTPMPTVEFAASFFGGATAPLFEEERYRVKLTLIT